MISRPLPRRNLDQFPATGQTVQARVDLLQKNHDLIGKKILFLGDHDLTSIAVAMLHLALEIVVAEIDRRVIDYLNYLSMKNKLKIKCLHYDARSGPLTFKNYFDVGFTDPPFTPSGLRLFLSRLIASLKKTGRLYFCYGYTAKEPERGLMAQKVITEAGILIEEKLLDFNHYTGAASIGNVSSIYVGNLTPQTRVVIPDRFKGPIYSGKKGKREY